MASEPESVDPLRQDLDDELSRTLVLFYRLSSEAIAEINALMRSLNIRFGDAALQSGAVTQKELDEALAWINQRAVSESRSVIATALRRSTQSREVLLWERDRLVPSERIILVHQPDHPHSETVRSLRTELLLRCSRRKGAKVIALLSPCGREGRSQLAAELAVSFAQLERRTLLVDADLRNPEQHNLFTADNESGLVQALSEAGPQHFHGIEGLPKMVLMTSGNPPASPLELLSGSRFDQAMAQWRRMFEFVILDTPPTTQFSDGLAVAAVAGNVLVLGRAEVTKFRDLTEICRSLSSTRSRILGAVINKF